MNFINGNENYNRKLLKLIIKFNRIILFIKLPKIIQTFQYHINGNKSNSRIIIILFNKNKITQNDRTK